MLPYGDILLLKRLQSLTEIAPGERGPNRVPSRNRDGPRHRQEPGEVPPDCRRHSDANAGSSFLCREKHEVEQLDQCDVEHLTIPHKVDALVLLKQPVRKGCSCGVLGLDLRILWKV
jgi:hypothetical protein